MTRAVAQGNQALRAREHEAIAARLGTSDELRGIEERPGLDQRQGSDGVVGCADPAPDWTLTVETGTLSSTQDRADPHGFAPCTENPGMGY